MMTDKNPDKLDLSAVLFDMDGTLINTIPLILASHQYAFNKIMGWAPTEQEILATIGEPLLTTFSRYGEHGDELMAEYIDWSVPRTASHSALFDGMLHMLEVLRSRGFYTGIVTARRCDGMQVCLDAFDLSDLFDVAICAEDTLRHKPHPEPLLLAMERLGITRPEQVLYVGDTTRDLESALSAGCHFAAVGWTAMNREEIDRLGPSFWIERAGELPDKIRFVKPV